MVQLIESPRGIASGTMICRIWLCMLTIMGEKIKTHFRMRARSKAAAQIIRDEREKQIVVFNPDHIKIG